MPASTRDPGLALRPRLGTANKRADWYSVPIEVDPPHSQTAEAHLGEATSLVQPKVIGLPRLIRHGHCFGDGMRIGQRAADFELQQFILDSQRDGSSIHFDDVPLLVIQFERVTFFDPQDLIFRTDIYHNTGHPVPILQQAGDVSIGGVLGWWCRIAWWRIPGRRRVADRHGQNLLIAQPR